MFKIKQSLDAVNYGAYFYNGTPLTMKEVVDRAAKFGYDAVDLWPHRPMTFPPDWSKQARKELLKYANDKGIKFAAVDACTNFMRSDHALVPLCRPGWPSRMVDLTACGWIFCCCS